MPLPLVIINPASADGATGEAWPGIAVDLSRHFGPYNCEFTEGAGDATIIAKREAASGRRFIIACGGDGTVNEVANGILESDADCEFGLIPSGTGGDFRRTLEISLRTSDAALALREGVTKRMDVGRVTYSVADGELLTTHFLNVASFGIGGEVIKRVKQDSWLPKRGSAILGGRLRFAAATLRTTVEFRSPDVAISLDDKPEFRLRLRNLCVANARYFGGGMKIAPEAKVDDGLLDVVAIGDLGALTILTNSYRVYLGTHLGLRNVHHTQARRVSAHSASGDEVDLEIDGELVGHLPASFEILPRALKIRCPR
jgi:YegS/Rv2252/BmrU family lipid kinase